MRCARRVEQRGLYGQHKGSFRMSTISNCIFRRGDLLACTAKVHGNRAETFSRPPWNGFRQCKVDLECPRSVLKSLQCASITRRESIARQRQQLTGRCVAKCERAVAVQVAKRIRIDAAGCVERAAQCVKVSKERVRDGARSTPCNGPADSVRSGAKHQSDG